MIFIIAMVATTPTGSRGSLSLAVVSRLGQKATIQPA